MLTNVNVKKYIDKQTKPQEEARKKKAEEVLIYLIAVMRGEALERLLRTIRGYIKVLVDSAKLQTPNFFIESTYINAENKEQPCYQ